MHKNTMFLHDEWQIRSSEGLDAFGYEIAGQEFEPVDWQPATLPATLFAALVDRGVVPDPHFGLNLKKQPGFFDFEKEAEHNFAYVHMRRDNPFRVPWWFRKEFQLEAGGKEVWLQLDGINYEANIWLNGKRIADRAFAKGFYNRFQINITKRLMDGLNTLALEIYPPEPDDLADTFVDWNPMTPDKNMGVWQPVKLITTNHVLLSHPYVRSHIHASPPGAGTPGAGIPGTGTPGAGTPGAGTPQTGESQSADLQISVECFNQSYETVKGTIRVEIEDIIVEKSVELGWHATTLVSLTKDDFPELSIQNPRLWWPYQLGEPELYPLKVSFLADGSESDCIETHFGIRNVEKTLNEFGALQLSVNGKSVQIRGAAWTPEIMLKHSSAQDTIDIEYLKNMNLNAIRLEGFLGSDNLWEICDREGILMLPGWSCGCHWFGFKEWKVGDLEVATESLRSQIYRLRSHPSLCLWMNGSDNQPIKHVEREYLKVLEELDLDVPFINAASQRVSELTGVSGVKMTGPYCYVPPSYWYDETMLGSAKGFNTETGPDSAIPPIESLRKMMPEDQLSIGSEAWLFHAGMKAFNDPTLMEVPIRERYGEYRDVEEFAELAQILSYECWRAMYEAFSRNRWKATGVIGWMLNAAWPNLIWHLYDSYNYPTGGFYGTQKGCTPLHVTYAYDDKSVYVINNRYERYEKCRVRARILTTDANELYSEEAAVPVGPYEVSRAFVLPQIDDLPSVHFVHLELFLDEELVSRNFYWLSSKPDVPPDGYDKEILGHAIIRMQEHADFRPLRQLPAATITSKVTTAGTEGERIITLNISNSSEQIAFFVQARAIDKTSGEWIVPVFWDDNCVSLLPGEEQTLTGRICRDLLPGDCDMDNLEITATGYNTT